MAKFTTEEQRRRSEFDDETERTKCHECGSRSYVYQGDNQAECTKCWSKFDPRLLRGCLPLKKGPDHG